MNQTGLGGAFYTIYFTVPTKSISTVCYDQKVTRHWNKPFHTY